MTVYKFKECLELGEEYENKIDKVFRHLYPHATIETVDMAAQKSGIDRRITNDNNTVTVEYKTDFLAHKTGNVYIETISVDSYNRLGWAHTCQADFLVYLIAYADVAYITRPSLIRSHLSEWQAQYPIVSVTNTTYNGMGILVPISKFMEISSVLDMNNEA